MENLLLTVVLTFVLLLLCMAGLGIGWILRGKPLTKNCGKPVDKNGECGKDQKCELCAPPKNQEPEE